MTREDLKPMSVDNALDWTVEGRKESANALAARVRSNAESAIQWYVAAKGPKKRRALLLRALTITSTSAAGLLAVLAPFLEDASGAPAIHAGWISFAAAVSAALLGIDRFLGYSRGWIRYITTELKIRTALNSFNLDWVRRESVCGDGPPDDEWTQDAITACAELGDTIDILVAEETAQWVVDFQASMRELGEATEAAREAARVTSEARAAIADARSEAARAKDDASRPGALNVTVTNGDEAQGEWNLTVEGGPSMSGSGKTGALANVRPGISVITVVGRIGGNDVRAEQALDIKPGEVTDWSVTLE